MGGTISGGLKAASTNKKVHGSDFYAKIGSKGGAIGKSGGFASNPELARIAGAKGGSRSKPGKWKPVTEEDIQRRIGQAQDLSTLGAEARAILRRKMLSDEERALAKRLYEKRRKEMLKQLDKELAQI